MRIAKRVFVFALVNLAVVTTLMLVVSALGLQPALQAKGFPLGTVAVFSLVWGFGGALISLAISRKMAKWTMGVRVIDPLAAPAAELRLVQRVHQLARKAGLGVMPEVGIYESEELNAFATGPSRNRALVAVSSGLLHRMSDAEVEGVLAHEVAHVANGDMVTMTVAQGVVNSLVLLVARLAAWGVGQAVEEERRPMLQFVVTMVAEVALGVLGILVVSAVSRRREFVADHQGALLSSPRSMIAALEALGRNAHAAEPEGEPALASLKISGRAGGFAKWFSTHPDLAVRVARLREKFGEAPRAIRQEARAQYL